MKRLTNFGVVLLSLALLLSGTGAQASPLNGTVQGYVTNNGGGGIANAMVFLNNQIFYTNASGFYTASEPAGTYGNMVAYAPTGSNYANAHQYNVTVSEGGVTTKNFTLSNSVGTLSGYVYDVNTNARISGVVLLVDSDVHDGWSNTQNATGSDGVFQMDHIAAGRVYYLHAFPPSPYTSVLLNIGTINPGANSFNVGLGTATTGVHGHVALPGGGNAVGAGILIGDSAGQGNTCTTQTDSNGNYTCSLPPGSYWAHVLEFSVYPGQLTLIQFNSGFYTLNYTLGTGPLTIHGQVRDYQLNPINGANVQAFEHASPFGYFRDDFVGGTGAYNFTGMGNRSTYLLQGAAAGYITRVYDPMPIPGNDWLFNYKLGHFPDVPAYDLNNRIEYPFFYVEFLLARGVVNGYSDGTFRPTTSVRRGEYAKLLVTAEGWAIDTSGGPHFSDVATNYAFYGHIETAYHHGAINGYPDGTFRPNSTVSRAEATKTSVAVSGWTLLNPATPSYNDVPTSQWAYRYIETARSHGANAGDDGGYFRPNAAGTRAETAKLVCVANTSSCQ